MLHIVLHFALPPLLALLAKTRTWVPACAWLLAGLVIDVDHLLATPVYESGRCSMGFHPLHTWPALLIYIVLTAYKPTRWFGYGLLLHLLLDTLDCFGMPAGSAQLALFFRWPAWIQ